MSESSLQLWQELFQCKSVKASTRIMLMMLMRVRSKRVMDACLLANCHGGRHLRLSYR